MDMRMPVTNGYKATQKIRATLKGQATVIVALTASAFEKDRKIVLGAGCSDLLILELIEPIPTESKTLALVLTELVDNFRFDRIMELARNPKQSIRKTKSCKPKKQ